METEYGELQIGQAARYGDEIVVETTADASERGGATKVLSVEAEVKPTGAELLDGEAEVTGKVNYRLLYLDRQDHLCGLDYFKDFKCRVKGEAITPSGKCSVHFDLPDADATIGGDTIALSAMVGVTVDYYGEKAERAVRAVSEAETLTKTFLSDRVRRSERTVELEKVVESGPNVKKIVLFGADAVVARVHEKEGGKDLIGEVRVDILYLNEADEIVGLSSTLPFVESFDEGRASYDVSVKNARIVLTDDEGGGSIEVEVALTVEEVAYDPCETSVVAAAIGERKEVIETVSVASCVTYLGQHFYEEPLTGTIPVKESGYVAFVRPGCHAIAEVEVEDGALRVEGVAAFRAAILTESGYQAVQGELPFSYHLPFEGAKAGQRAEVGIVVSDVKGSEVDGGVQIKAKACLSVTLSDRSECAYLSDAVEGEEYPESNAGISVYFAEKGEDPWSIARAMKVLPSALVAANPFLAEPLQEDKKVLIIRKK